MRGVSKSLTCSDAYKASVIENLLREQLNPLERGIAFQQMIEKGLFKSQSQLATELGIARTSVVKAIGFVERLDRKAVEYLLGKYDAITEGHLQAVMRAPQAKQRRILEQIVSDGWTRTQTRDHINETYYKKNTKLIDYKKAGPEWALALRVSKDIPPDETKRVVDSLREAINQLEATTANGG